MLPHFDFERFFDAEQLVCFYSQLTEGWHPKPMKNCFFLLGHDAILSMVSRFVLRNPFYLTEYYLNMNCKLKLISRQILRISYRQNWT